MLPRKELITIIDNEQKIKDFLQEIVVAPRKNIEKWAKETGQTAGLRLGYIGQHLASLAVGMKGTSTGARGKDIIDGSEVKSCYRIDQVDTCKKCKKEGYKEEDARVARYETKCPRCGSKNIKRNKDSKWLFSIRNEDDYKDLVENTERIVLVLGDYPEFDENKFDKLRFQVFEIWVQSERNKIFKERITYYYEKVYLPDRKKYEDKEKKSPPASENFYPDKIPFFFSNPILVFSCIIDEKNNINIEKYVQPASDRMKEPYVPIPTKLFTSDDIKKYFSEIEDDLFLPLLKNETKDLLELKSLLNLEKLEKPKIVKILPFINKEICDKMLTLGFQPIKDEKKQK